MVNELQCMHVAHLQVVQMCMLLIKELKLFGFLAQHNTMIMVLSTWMYPYVRLCLACHTKITSLS